MGAKARITRSAERLFRSAAAPSLDQPDPMLWPDHTSRLEPLTFRRAPALWAAFWFSFGIFAHRFVWHPCGVWLVAASILAALVLAALSRRVNNESIRLLPLAALWLVAGIASASVQPAPSQQTTLRFYADGLSRTVRGRILRVRALAPRVPDEDLDTEGYQEPEQPAALSIDLDVDAIEDVTPDISRMVQAPGGVRATLTPAPGFPAPSLSCGETIEVAMRLRVPERYRDPGAWQYADYLLDQGIAAHATIHSNHLTTAFPAKRPWSAADLRCRLYAAQEWAAARMIAYTRSAANHTLPRALRLSPADAGMLNAMLFGDRAGLNHQLRLGFERTGSFHLFVVSGMHIGLIAIGLFWITRRAASPYGPRRS